MPLIKICLESSNKSKIFESSCLIDLIKQVENHFGIELDRLVRSSDNSVIEDEDCFQLLTKNTKEIKDFIAIPKIIELQNKSLLNEIEKYRNDIRKLESLLEESDSEEIENSKENIKKLSQRYKKLIHDTSTTRIVEPIKIKMLEKKLDYLKNKQDDLHLLFSNITKTDNIDFCFLIDCTSSMTTYINQVYDSLNGVLKKIKNIYGDIHIRFSYVGYRDFSELDQRIISIPFIDDLELFKQLLNEIETFGGEDECEDVFGGLLRCSELDWSSSVRILFHLCDAPCHGKRFHTNLQDLYPKGDPLQNDIKDLLTNLHKLKITYYFAQLNKSTLKMIEEFNKELDDYKIIGLKLGKISNLICQTIQESILKTTVSRNPNLGIRIKQIVEIDWCDLKSFKTFNVDYFTSDYLKDYRDLQTKFRMHNTKLMISDEPFSQGVLRYAYPCLHLLSDIDKDCVLKCVIKESVYTNPEFNIKKYHEECVHIQSIANHLAHEFSKLNKEFKIRFLSVDLVRIHEKGIYYTIEEFVEGDFIKWMNNEGKWNTDQIEILSAFSHWTYDTTNGYILITDLQGFVFDKNKEFILTDPAVICQNESEKFGKANLGLMGVESFFENHKCNSICNYLKLRKFTK